MHDSSHPEPLRQSLKQRVEHFTGENIAMCYQCGKCTAGCPLGTEMDYTPNQILRMLQLDMPAMEEKILSSLGIWLCLSCETCFTRCPQEVDFPKVMDFLRSESIRLGKVHPQAKDIIAFHKTFLNSIRSNGRTYEMGLVVGYKMRTGHLFQDVLNSPKMFSKGLLNIMPHKVKGKEAIEKIFAKTGNKEDSWQ